MSTEALAPMPTVWLDGTKLIVAAEDGAASTTQNRTEAQMLVFIDGFMIDAPSVESGS
jgi:hypothetical protein